MVWLYAKPWHNKNTTLSNIDSVKTHDTLEFHETDLRVFRQLNPSISLYHLLSKGITEARVIPP